VLFKEYDEGDFRVSLSFDSRNLLQYLIFTADSVDSYRRTDDNEAYRLWQGTLLETREELASHVGKLRRHRLLPNKDAVNEMYRDLEKLWGNQ